jgi:MFS family permease
VLIGGILLGLLLGLLSGGRLQNLASVQLRWTPLLVAAVVVRFGTEFLLGAQVGIVEALRLPLMAAGFGLLLVALWANRGYPGLSLAFLGILSNALVIIVNGGFMPIWQVSLDAAGLSIADVTPSALHVVIQGSAVEFLTRALILGDVVPIPLPFFRNVASLGDLFLGLGLAFFLFASVVRVPTSVEEREDAEIRARLRRTAGAARGARPDGRAGPPAETGLAPALQSSASLERPVFLGTRRPTVAAPALAPLGEMSTAEFAALEDAATTAIPLPRPSAEVLARVRRHPYVRLALNGSFTALWAGQLVSIFGDRIHQVALAAAVLLVTGSPLATALVFVAATLPNLVFGPIAGTFVDRWDHKEVLVVSDLLRAATVLVIPIAVVTNIVIVYPLVFVLTTISVFFRPARIAILPRIVREDELLTANSALWVGETLGDVIGWPLAGLFVGFLGASLPIAFWLDAATYGGSALLLSTIVVHAVSRVGPTSPLGASVVDAAAAAELQAKGFRNELRAGWRFLRNEPVLLANTLQATIAQLTVGVLIGLTAVYAEQVFGRSGFDFKAVYAFIEGSQGAGNLIGGFAVGLIGIRLAKGRMIIVGYTVFGLLTTLLALSGNLGVVLALAFGIGVANMVFVIPSQTLFQERTPQQLMGRVVGFRFALVFGAMTFAIAFGGFLAEVVGTTTVIATFGLVSMAAGIAGWFVPAVRDA